MMMMENEIHFSSLLRPNEASVRSLFCKEPFEIGDVTNQLLHVQHSFFLLFFSPFVASHASWQSYLGRQRQRARASSFRARQRLAHLSFRKLITIFISLLRRFALCIDLFSEKSQSIYSYSREAPHMKLRPVFASITRSLLRYESEVEIFHSKISIFAILGCFPGL